MALQRVLRADNVRTLSSVMPATSLGVTARERFNPMSPLGYLLSVMRDSQNEPHVRAHRPLKRPPMSMTGCRSHLGRWSPPRKWEDQPSFGVLVKSGRVPKVIEFVLHPPTDFPPA
jgi:hypothetical protein